MDSMKLINVMNYVSPVVSTQKPPLIRQNTERQSSVVYFGIKDRVTLSAKAKVMSRNITPVLIDDSASSILAYEISKPFAAPAFP
jgi:hypothetical protein